MIRAFSKLIFLLPPPPAHPPNAPIHQLHAAFKNVVDILPIDGLATMNAVERLRGQAAEHLTQRFGVKQRAAIAEVGAGVVALAAEGYDAGGGDEILVLPEE